VVVELVVLALLVLPMEVRVEVLRAKRLQLRELEQPDKEIAVETVFSLLSLWAAVAAVQVLLVV
jgi:hypothetical protein